MNKFIKRICIILCLAFVFSALSACNQSTEEEPEESVSEPSADSEPTDTSVKPEESEEEETFETELVEDLVSFIDYTRSTRGYHSLKSGGNAAVSFTIPEGQLKKLYLNISDNQKAVVCSIQLDIYSFNGNYKNTIATEPIYSEYITESLRTYTVEFEDGQMCAGDYLVVLSYVDPKDLIEIDTEESESSTETETDTETGAKEEAAPVEIHTKVVADNFWYNTTLPEEYEQYNLRSYINDRANKKTSFCGGFVIEYPQKVTESETEETETDNNYEYPDNTAKVILLGGQSNATGASYGSFLKQKVSPEQYEEYVNGYSNVKILYSSGTLSEGLPSVRNKNNEFVDVKLGQGISASAFGPELGLAAYLSKTYPDETFYIIKYAIGGSGLYAHWNPEDEEKSSCLTAFKETVDHGLELLEDQGLDPRIMAFVWMQGESDASTFYRAHEYYRLQKTLVEDIRSEYGFYEAFEGIAFVDATITDLGVWASFFLVNECKLKYAEESSINFCVDTNKHGLTTLEENNDNAHYDSTSMILLGELFGAEISKHLN